jgi:hypothetical protein
MLKMIPKTETSNGFNGSSTFRQAIAPAIASFLPDRQVASFQRLLQQLQLGQRRKPTRPDADA